MDLVGTALPLVGVALGTVGTLTGQYLATRGEARHRAEQAAADLRAERKAAIAAFLDIVQRIEQVLDNRRQGATGEPPDLDDRLHTLWLSKKLLELVCSFELATAAHRYTTTLDRLARHTDPDLDARQRATRGQFMETARDELGVTGPRLYRTASPPDPDNRC